MTTKPAAKPPQNRTPAGQKRLPAAAVPHQWKPGQSGNPGGRAKGLGLLAHLRAITNDGALIADHQVHLALHAKDERVQADMCKHVADRLAGVVGQPQVDAEWMRAAAEQLGRDPDQMVAAWRTLRGDKSA